ncbi:phosphoribosyltransferase family protein [Pontibacter anaerobius]|uniref:Phosphoribosyltransferase family protein n=1 Tax=Pontibacter anaerobius TaxID=2993940 RepID=A0ABT3R9U4_9BACT|nr:phosphoribosyltransferase family protein [Pontibacter anaerobius]MCX2738596.1 phosphoribosyltransferase family protein [Pontibacter anaerobius]
MTPQHKQQNLILDRTQIEQKVKRIAYEIYERNFEEQELVLAGIYPSGHTLAERLAEQLQQISPIKVSLLQVTLNKDMPLQEPVQLQPENISLADKVVVLVDDVLNTGKTLAYTLNAFLPQNPKKVEVATLVDRHHPLYPISSTYTGYSLATTLRERVQVVLQEDEVAAYLL